MAQSHDIQLTEPRAVQRSHWWREVLIVASFYGLYTLVRDLRGDKPVSVHHAFLNARRTIRWERWVGMFHERDLQHAVISQRWLIQLCDDYYGSFHFVVTVGVLLLMFFWFPTTYRKWRNVLALTTGLALIGFYFFPLMPPRLLPQGYGFVDTLQSIGGLWNFSNGPVNDVSNQYAAMPSLHTAWSLWCSLALSRVIRPLWARIAVFAYPAFTVFSIVVTGNHFFADAVAGVALVLVSISVAVPVTRALDRRARRREAAHRHPPAADTASAALGTAPTGVK
ncbi:MAG TPA: phosphatase PAP2 family protein [Acidimicrobiales bacterium]|nr:phosphatase PAP2 family protein [Acidimicrobiales bacterium]